MIASGFFCVSDPGRGDPVSEILLAGKSGLMGLLDLMALYMKKVTLIDGPIFQWRWVERHAKGDITS